MTDPNPPLGISGFRYVDLYDVKRLEELSLRFDEFVASIDRERFDRFHLWRSRAVQGVPHGGFTAPEESNLLIEVARDLSRFLITLFAVEREAETLREHANRDAAVARFKKEFVARRVAKVQALPDPSSLDSSDRSVAALIAVLTESTSTSDHELALAATINKLVDFERHYPRTASLLAPSAESRNGLIQIFDRLKASKAADEVFGERIFFSRSFGGENTPEAFRSEAASLYDLVDFTVAWAAGRWRKPSRQWPLSEWTSFRLPAPMVFDKLVELEGNQAGGLLELRAPQHHLRRRDGFGLTDPRFTPRQITDEAFYCIYCHERSKDSCAHGFLEKDNKTYKTNPLGVPLEGCPLDEKIGEMNLLRAEGDAIASLAMVMIDNPMCAGTGHRICNDCMRSCIFQKQEPVNIPQVETGVLTDVLFLPWGFEIYALLTRWNPLYARTPVMRPYNGLDILVVGLGPAGYTLAHYLANEGFGVVGIDALKLEPLPADLVGDGVKPPIPIKDLRLLWDRLDDRLLAGFGGVSEYGITVRWDKNFLKCIRIALERRRNIRFYGGVRFGGTLELDDTFDHLGFDHIAIAAGAGTPTIVRMKNNLVRGIRKASDFLMALQLTGAFKSESMANLQVRLPALVIGGGLTAIDTATELLAYYPVQVEKILERYRTLCQSFGEESIRAGYDAEELETLDEFLEHGRAIAGERERAVQSDERPDFLPLLRHWGSVSIAYRKSLNDSPAYRLNYEEVAKAMEEGIGYFENLSPVEARTDSFGHLQSVVFETQTIEDGRWVDSGKTFELPARSIMVAAGTSPNVIYEKEHPGTFRLDQYQQFFQMHRVERNGSLSLHEMTDLHEPPAYFTSYAHPSESDGPKLVSFYGDNHPRFAGNVVKAMASAKYGFPHVVDLFTGALARIDHSPQAQQRREEKWEALLTKLDDGLLAHVVTVNRLTPTIVEVIVRAPFAARRFRPGQFYRLQNFESFAISRMGTRLVMEGIALTGAWVDVEQGLLSLIILEMGGSSRLCAMLQPGEPVVVMGPTGTPTEIPQNETILLAGGGLGNAVLFSIARALKENGCRVVYFAGYKKSEDVFKRDEIEAATDQVIWAVDRGEMIAARRTGDFSFVGNIVQAMLAYATGEIVQRAENQGSDATPIIKLHEVSRLIAIGSDGMMRAVRDARKGVLQPYLAVNHVGIGSINSPMQCMMKQVCAQCLQRHVDPITGKESFVFSCFNQDQTLDDVDFDNLRARLRQNTVMEKLTNLWLTRLLSDESQAERPNLPS